MAVAALLVIQIVAIAAAFGVIWRKLDRISADVAGIKRMLETLELMRFSSAAQRSAAQQPVRPEPALAPSTSGPAAPPRPDDDPFDAAWVRPNARVPRDDAGARPLPGRASAARQMMANEIGDDLPGRLRANLSPETMRMLAAAAMALAPAFGIAFGAPHAGLIASGLSICAALMLVALRPIWAGAAFVGAFAAGGWALTAFALETAQTAPLAFSATAAIAGGAGLVHTRLRGAAPGLLMALLMSGALLFLSNAIGFISAAGAGYGLIVAGAAAVGASTRRLFTLHLAAFVGAMLGLFWFSGQPSAAIWFTPITAWIGALFLAIAALRTPMLGARAAWLCTTGTAAPLLSCGALSLSQQGLANPFAAAGAFLALAAIFGALIAVSAQREQRGVAGLGLTAWILLAGAMIAFVTAALLALTPPFAASVSAAAAMTLVARDYYRPLRIWRAGALGLLITAGSIAIAVLSRAWPDLITLCAALLVPSALAAAAAVVSERRASPAAGVVFEALALTGFTAGAVALVRLALSGGTPNQTPVGFVEAGVHIATWAFAALGLAALHQHGAALVRRVGAAVLGVAALCGAVVSGLLWFTPFWTTRLASGVDFPLLQHAPLGFALPAIAAWSHWVFWRAKGVQARTRIALGSAALLSAAFLTLEAIGARQGAVAPGQTDWPVIIVIAAAFGLAIAVNFMPGVTDETGAQLRFNKYFQRHRRREQRT